jgi:hypothetical protein
MIGNCFMPGIGGASTGLSPVPFPVAPFFKPHRFFKLRRFFQKD